MHLPKLAGLLSFISAIDCINFPFEARVLEEGDIGNFSAISFGNRATASPVYDGPECKVYPGTATWPNEAEWTRLNSTLDGALLKPIPAAAACYSGPFQNTNQCNFLLRNTSSSRFYINDPLTVLAMWPEGDTCYASASTAGLNCTQGGWPSYVVNVTTVKQIQAAVNFARNKNLRLVVKNTGHDFYGRSIGFGAISIWTHWLKQFEFLPEYSIGEYRGMAARVGAGLESWELFAYMSRHNMTVLVAGPYTVGAYGGWISGGGHSALASTYGMGADQVLSLDVVTADGRFVTADVNQNTDLFFALRGGGGSNYGIVTSAIVKAHPATSVLSSPLRFSVQPTTNSSATGLFWAAFDEYHRFGLDIVDNGGTAYSNVNRIAPQSGSNALPGASFSTTIEMPGMSATQITAFVKPLYDRIAALGFTLPASAITQASNWQDTSHGVGDVPGSGGRFASRIFPRVSFENSTRFAATQRAIRNAVEAGYQFHGINMAPSLDIAGYPGSSSAVNPAFRTGVMFADVFENTNLRGLSAQGVRDAHAKFNVYMDQIRQATPEGGSYINECDVEEPDWQKAFFGSNYARLAEVKASWDPWSLFYTPLGVGSEAWIVRSVDHGMPTQDGPLCRVES
ncbi:FAD binding domain-containing protein [Xylaria bambusicola]|uniref:FAD binding domain-containing protein n=1 Tax=Xylaria bambusicola TaxID=326684 RepID=UPI002008E594|nr:FAD binding domain-containing protein [Xylaria bambusicola]KAI0503130.1 FAD binding domain-containing protein [Xylaria bambusicola]